MTTGDHRLAKDGIESVLYLSSLPIDWELSCDIGSAKCNYVYHLAWEHELKFITAQVKGGQMLKVIWSNFPPQSKHAVQPKHHSVYIYNTQTVLATIHT